MSFIKAAIKSTFRSIFSRRSQAASNTVLEENTRLAPPKRKASVAFSQRSRSSSVSSYKRVCIPINSLRHANDNQYAVGCEKRRLSRTTSETVDPKIESYSSSDDHVIESRFNDNGRALMPPPIKPRLVNSIELSLPHQLDESYAADELASLRSKSIRDARTDIVDEYDMEEARRRAVATRLPPDSGAWEHDERELFFHLAYRGFEPLLDHSWMIDFPTLPISIFAHEGGDPPLIDCQRSTPFRATKALEELLMAGTKVRDHNIAHRDLRGESVLEKAASRYIAWALRDAKLPVPDNFRVDFIPIHVFSTMRHGEATGEVLYRLALNMHLAAARHRSRQATRLMRKHRPITPEASSLTDTAERTSDDESTALPVIYGIAICRSVLTIFTLSCHAPVPASLAPYIAQSPTMLDSSRYVISDISLAVPTRVDSDVDLGVRYIAAFDFSEATRDVWNSLAIAILTIQIRKTISQHISQTRFEIDETREDSWLSNGVDGAIGFDESELLEGGRDPDA